jgi:2'-5' RNA ligase
MTAATHSLWLMPKEADAQRLTAIVGDLSRRFGTPVFTPHLTLKCDSDRGAAALEIASAKAAAAVAAFTEPVKAIETSDAYFRSFYARFAMSPPLARLKQMLDAETTDAFMPHVSLLYGTVAPGPKAAAVGEIARLLVGQQITFDRICVVTSGQDVPIADWRVVATAWLS